MDERSSDARKEGTVPKDEQAVEQGARNRERLDEIPEPGTDPLHEGPWEATRTCPAPPSK